MMYPNWVRGVTQPEVVGLEDLANHIDRICQLSGSTKHAAIGTELDGGFGYEQTPRDLNVYSDLQKLAGVLASRKYADEDIEGIFNRNWLRFFGENLPA
jgi:membrane dipeptidase